MAEPWEQEIPDPDRCSDCGRSPVVERSDDDRIRWCQSCVDSAIDEMRVYNEEFPEGCSLERAYLLAAEEGSTEPLRRWVEAWTGQAHSNTH